jgi:type VI secretion system protein ImpH
MGTEVRSNTSSLIDDLTKNGPSYNVWQAVWLGENITKKENPSRKDFLLDQKGLKFRPYDVYIYPPRDIDSISYEDRTLTYVLTFLGLYGTNSPLPRCYHEQVAMQLRILGKGEVPLQNFLDIFNNRFYWLYYQSWKKYRFYLFLNDDPNSKITGRINSFIGRSLLPKERKSTISDFLLLKFSGIFSQRVRNKAGINILLSYLFPKYNVYIREYTPCWLELQGTPKLGNENFKLGINSLIGKYILSFTSRITVEIGPVTFEEYLTFLPGTLNSNRLIELMNLYVNDGLEFNLEFKIISDTISSVSWTDERLKLGKTVWLGKPGNEVIKVRINYEEFLKNN